ncbi:Protein of unknown function [Gryllus bimaculatus]|nr:Protein of unknown function [Gryllus bimaculatus]
MLRLPRNSSEALAGGRGPRRCNYARRPLRWTALARREEVGGAAERWVGARKATGIKERW